MDRFVLRSSRWAVLRRLGGAALTCVVTLAACGGSPAPVAPPEAVAQERARLLEPFQTGRDVVADHLELVMTANFLHDLEPVRVLPGVQEEGRVERPDGGYELVYRNRSPRDQLLLTVGETRMYLLREARVVVLGGRSEYRLEATLDGDASGSPVSVVEAGARADCRQVRIADGVCQRVR